MTRRTIYGLSALALLITTSDGWAQPPPAPGVRAHAAHVGQKDKGEAKAASKSTAGAPEAKAASKSTAGAPEAKAPADDPERATRARKARRLRLASMLQRVSAPSEIPMAVRAELRHHARRIARLSRIAALAKEKGEAKVLLRVDALLGREMARHAAKMERFWPSQPSVAPTAPDEQQDEQGDEGDMEAEPDEEQGAQP